MAGGPMVEYSTRRFYSVPCDFLELHSSFSRWIRSRLVCARAEILFGEQGAAAGTSSEFSQFASEARFFTRSSRSRSAVSPGRNTRSSSRWNTAASH